MLHLLVSFLKLLQYFVGGKVTIVRHVEKKGVYPIPNDLKCGRFWKEKRTVRGLTVKVTLKCHATTARTQLMYTARTVGLQPWPAAGRKQI